MTQIFISIGTDFSPFNRMLQQSIGFSQNLALTDNF